MITITLYTKIYPSEDQEIIEQILNQFGIAENSVISEISNTPVKSIEKTFHGLESTHFIFNQVRRNRTVEAFRQFLLARLKPEADSITFMINKQVLTNGKIVLCKTPSESPLGPVWVTLKSANLLLLINYLFPPTQKGIVLESDIIPQD
ncbi:MAG: hypothetical protein DRO88_03820 [Promethearchaeia archaeon]|nr:MAG: hypothetical protein DRO88_03820 [Candidatus Lokiarchaeia archaeon]